MANSFSDNPFYHALVKKYNQRDENIYSFVADAVSINPVPRSDVIFAFAKMMSDAKNVNEKLQILIAMDYAHKVTPHILHQSKAVR